MDASVWTSASSLSCARSRRASPSCRSVAAPVCVPSGFLQLIQRIQRTASSQEPRWSRDCRCSLRTARSDGHGLSPPFGKHSLNHEPRRCLQNAVPLQSARQAHYKRNGQSVFAGSDSERTVAKLTAPASQSRARKMTAGGWEVWIVDDSPVHRVVPQEESQESLSESHKADLMTSEATNAESTQALTISSNGSSPRKIAANRRNAKKSTGPKTSRGKTITSWNSTRHGLLAE